MKKWSANQRNTVFAAVSSWGLDAFDFFLLIFVIDNIADSFHASNADVSIAIFLTLAMRPIGAIFIGKMAEKYGRKPVLMANVATFSILSALSAFAPTLSIFILIRCIYGVAMGGIWGVASSLAFETIPSHAKGFVSGLFQAGYPLGYLTASVIYALFFNSLGWQYLFIIGTFPILLVVFIYFFVEESSTWLKNKSAQKTTTAIMPIIRSNWNICIYAIILMACFNFFSHGTGDVYPLFLKVQHYFSPFYVSAIAIAYNISSIMGGLLFGYLSEKIGRPQSIIIACVGAILFVPLWAFSSGLWSLGIGAFIIQFMVQGAWGVVPIYLTELTPPHARTILPSLFYQFGNLLASMNSTIQINIADHYHHNYGIALATVASISAFCIISLVTFSIIKPNRTIRAYS